MKKLLFLFPLIGLTGFLTSCNDKAPVDQESFLAKLFPNPWDALAVFLAFIVLLLVVFFFAYKPVKNLIKKRGDYVEGKIKNAEEKEKNAELKVKQSEEQIKTSQKEAMEIIEKAKLDATKERNEIKEKAKLDADKEVERAKEQIAQEIEASKDQIHEEIVSVAVQASSKILEREVSKKDNEKLIDDFIDELEK